MTRVATAEIEALARTVLLRHGASEAQAGPMAVALARAEAEGNPICGLYYLPIFAGHLDCGKVDGTAVPTVTVSEAVIQVDAGNGFAHPAIAAGTPALVEAARSFGVATMTIARSYNSLALAHHSLPLAEAGLVGLCVSNAPASVAPPGATGKLFGTNPIAFAVPGANGAALVVDQSMSAVTWTAMRMKREAGEPIPTGWAQDREGRPTTDPAAGLSGALLPSGGQKGANLALLVELLAACLSGASLSTELSPLGDNTGGPPDVGQFLLAIDPARHAPGFADRLARLAESFTQAGAALPGRRFRDPPMTEVDVSDALWETCRRLA